MRLFINVTFCKEGCEFLSGIVSYLDNVTLYSAKLRNPTPTQVATKTTALDLGVVE
jgi:hypothetical protein